MAKTTGLTETRIRILRRAVYGRHGGPELGVVRRNYIQGLEAVSEKRSIAWLCEQGYLEANPHGDWYITDTGKEAAGVNARGEPLVAD